MTTRSRLNFSPFAQAALREPILRALELGAGQVKATLTAVGKERGPWSVVAYSRDRLVEHRGYDLEALCFEVLERFALGADTRGVRWIAGEDGLGHAHGSPRTPWTLCGKPAITDQFARTEISRCRACVHALPIGTPNRALSEEQLIAAYGGLPSGE